MSFKVLLCVGCAIEHIDFFSAIRCVINDDMGQHTRLVCPITTFHFSYYGEHFRCRSMLLRDFLSPLLLDYYHGCF